MIARPRPPRRRKAFAPLFMEPLAAGEPFRTRAQATARRRRMNARLAELRARQAERLQVAR